ncbi:hypothetical protein K491DRAFT_689203 [Lophiostoma macrostomum CBS 122681]|uniref:Uncharacterized protein n=1 Tax=Lophiostoma macrostomum CBS 122681 TaxID=1314788 RepID=A0A6A6THW8_9PLEO|nr:hypothetical protein K491DRAFT_689203 [Lophiostoma macrostomum CBS 122681]
MSHNPPSKTNLGLTSDQSTMQSSKPDTESNQPQKSEGQYRSNTTPDVKNSTTLSNKTEQSREGAHPMVPEVVSHKPEAITKQGTGTDRAETFDNDFHYERKYELLQAIRNAKSFIPNLEKRIRVVDERLKAWDEDQDEHHKFAMKAGPEGLYMLCSNTRAFLEDYEKNKANNLMLHRRFELQMDIENILSQSGWEGDVLGALWLWKCFLEQEKKFLKITQETHDIIREKINHFFHFQPASKGPM